MKPTPEELKQVTKMTVRARDIARQSDKLFDAAYRNSMSVQSHDANQLLVASRYQNEVATRVSNQAFEYARKLHVEVCDGDENRGRTMMLDAIIAATLDITIEDGDL